MKSVSLFQTQLAVIQGKRGVKNFFPHPNELLIWARPENLVEIGLVVEALDEFCGTGDVIV